MAACPSCRAGNPDGAKFCNQCGAKLVAAAAPAARSAGYTPKHLVDKVLRTRAALVGERKRVTVLFADIKGSTRLAEQAGPEAWHAVLDRFFSILTGAVHRFEGTVNQYTGDGIMALFGAPVAHEDHAQRACHAALAMQAEVRRFADELRIKQGLNLTLRVGLNTGEVIVGRIGDDLRMDYTAQGLTVNLAARMEQICEPGHAYLTRNVASLVEGYFKLRDLGAMEVEGADQPVPVFDLEGEGRMRTRLERQMARAGARFVGREPELKALHAAAARARDGCGEVVAVVGNAGIGKSRLCHEFARACEGAGFEVHRATGVPYAGALPLFPVQALLRSRLRLPDGSDAEEVRRLAAGTFLLQDPAHAKLLPAILDFLGVPDGTVRAPEQMAALRERMMKLLSAWLPRADRPQVLLVEDLHFADPATESFLEALCSEVRDTPTLLLLNYRPDWVSEGLIPRLDEQVQVTALTDAQIAALVRELCGEDDSLSGIDVRVAERAQGNPFYAEEAVLSLVESGFLEGEAGHYRRVRPIDEWRIPDSVHSLIASRIDRLQEGHKTLLHHAAVIGQDFEPALLGQLAEREDAPLTEDLGVLEDSGFVHQHEDDPPLFRFCHPLVQEVAYETQLETSRAEAHRRLAAKLEQAHPIDGAPNECSVRIAHHYGRAGEWAKAGTWRLAAARWSGMRDARQTADLYRNAIDELDRAAEDPDTLRQRVLARAGLVRMAQFTAVTDDELNGAFEQARALATRQSDTAGLVELMLSYAGEQIHRGDAETAIRIADEAVQQAIDAGANEVVHRFRLSVLLTHNAAGRPREGLELVNRAAGTGWMTEPIGEENFMSRGFYGLMLIWLGRLDEARDNLEQAVEYSEREDRAASWMHANFVDLAWANGDYSGVMARARNAVERAQAFGSPFFIAVAVRVMGLALCMDGDPKQAVSLMRPLLPEVAPGGLAHQFEANFLASFGRALRQAGEDDEGWAFNVRGVESAQRSHSRVWEAAAWIALLEHGANAERRPHIDRGLERTGALLEETGAEGLRPFWLEARARHAGDDRARARWLRDAANAYREIGAQGHVRRLAAQGARAR